MPKTCAICDKGTSIGNNRKLLRGHYNITSKRTFKPNLQKTTVDGRRVWACAKCRKNLIRSQA